TVSDSLIDRYGSIYTVSGSTLTPIGPNFKVTDTSFLPWFGQDPVVVSTYMGDYDQAAADNSNFYTTWGDNLTASTTGADVSFDKVTTGGVVLGPIAGSGSAASVSLPPGGTTAAITAGSPWVAGALTVTLSPSAIAGMANIATTTNALAGAIGTVPTADDAST